MDKSREWAARCVHEAQLWDENAFVTLTYREVPVLNGVPSLQPRDFVTFMKRLRKEFPGTRFLQAGEYGKLGRPHHHAVLFNCGFRDLVPLGKRGDSMLYRSAALEKLWPHGFSSVGSVTFQSAGYVARYTLKKVGAPGCSRSNDLEAVEVEGRRGFRVPEYMTMSRRPGIGGGWIDRFHGDVFPHDEVVLGNGQLMKPPRYYDERYAKVDPEAVERARRIRARSVNLEERRGSRYWCKELLARRRVEDKLKRDLS